MASVPKKVVERYIKAVPKFQRVLGVARDRDVNEADTVSIIQDMLAEVFGFEKYLEITSEYSIRNTYCDLAIKMDKKVQYLLEVKAIGIGLKDVHLRQAIDYGANHGVQWVVLSNAVTWEIYRIRFERPIDYDLVSSFNFLEINPRKTDDQEKLFLLSKKGVNASVREEYYARVQSVNRFIIGAIILSDSVSGVIKREIRKLAPGIKINDKEIDQILRNEILKRDVIEGDEAVKAIARVRRMARKPLKRTVKPPIKKPEAPIIPSYTSDSKSTQSTET